MAESRAADYIAIGASRGAENFLAGLEKRRDEEKNKAKKFKALVAFSEASGLLSKDQAEVMDVDSLEGFVEGKMSARNMERQDQAAALNQFMQMQKLQEFEQAQRQFGAIQNFQQDFNAGMVPSDFYENPERYPQGRPAGDSLAAFQTALAQNPGVAPGDLNTFMSSYDKALPPAAKQWAPTDLARYMKDLKDARASGDDAAATTIQAAIAKMVAPSGMRIEFDDRDRPIITQGDISAPTTAFKTEAQKNEANAAATFATIDHIMANQKASDWGVAGLVGKVKDEWLAQVFPGIADPRRVNVQASVSQLRQQVMSALKAETQLSQKDKEELLASAPKVTAGESPISAMEKMHRFRQLISERIRSYSVQLGKLPPVYAMTIEQIGEAVDKGVMTEQEAVDAIQKYHQDRLK